MNSSNSPQTLFRFASLRNPNLTETKPVNLGFIHRPPKMEGVFDGITVAENQSKYGALMAATENFQAITSVKDLEDGIFGELLKIGKSLSKQDKLSTKEKSDSKAKYLDVQNNEEIRVQIKNLWDNLIYQYLKQKNIYVKDAICFILKGLHVGYVQTLTTTEELKKLNGSDFLIVAYDAQIVLPHGIFDEVEMAQPKSKNDDIKLTPRENILLEVEMQKANLINTSKVHKEALQALKPKLEKIQKAYHKEFDKAHQEAYQNYLNENGEQMSAFDRQIEIIDELIEKKASEEEIEKAKRELESLSVKPFAFDYKKELNWEDLTQKLSEEDLKLFIENFTNINEVAEKSIDFSKAKKSIKADDTYTLDEKTLVFEQENYFEVFEVLHQKVNALGHQIIKNSTLEPKVFAKVGHVLLPVVKNNNNLNTFLYSIHLNNTSVLNNNRSVNLVLTVENESYAVSQLVINAQTDTGTHHEVLSNFSPQNHLITFPAFLVNKFVGSINSMTFQIFFTNGRTATIQIGALKTGEGARNLFNLDPNSSSPSTTNSKRQHFGVKRLGVAEYMKVVQTVHAYVPGEVSNIENVMASELRHKSMTEFTHTEDTLASSKSQEVEKISDTTKTNRAEMQTETAQEIARQQSMNAHVNFSAEWGAVGTYKLDTGVSYATNNSQVISNRQSVAKAQEITERAMERVQLKISEERIQKIIQEVTQTNVHEFDNRNGKQHITGVYRWVDKKMKNQIYNYGKRTMFEFMIPEPAKLHRLAHEVGGQHVFIEPIDPRKATENKIVTALEATETQLVFWADYYGVTLTTRLPQNLTQNFERIEIGVNGNTSMFSRTINIAENYVANSATVWHGFSHRGLSPRLIISDFKGGMRTILPNYIGGNGSDGHSNFNSFEISGNYEYLYYGLRVGNVNLRFQLQCTLSAEYILRWKTENFNAIIQAYQTALTKYNEDVANWQAKQDAKKDEAKEKMTRFYRNIESDVIKHNCMAYLLQDYLNKLGTNFTNGNLMENFSVTLNDDLDKYTSLAKFLEQAFEWSIMDYTFYPYYWASRTEWQKMYLTESDDQLFRNFLQAGLVRVVVTVRPGFEAAVQYFLATGKVWMGGEAPVIGDPLFMSIAQEMIEPTGKPQGKYWITRIPTTLTILQDKSTGLSVDEPLPIFPESDPNNCENPAELESESQFKIEDVVLEASDKPSTLPKD